jgi:hypothetical protein
MPSYTNPEIEYTYHPYYPNAPIVPKLPIQNPFVEQSPGSGSGTDPLVERSHGNEIRLEDAGLDHLVDGPAGEKPPYPYPTLIRCAIQGSPRKYLTLQDIYYAIAARFPYFQNPDLGDGWKVRYFPLYGYSHIYPSLGIFIVSISR